MRELSSSMWQKRGCSVVFDRKLLGPLLASNPAIPLRTALGWMGSWPADAPDGRQTVVVGGLDTVLEIMAPPKAEAFIRTSIRSLIAEFQDHWSERGLVFGLVVAPQRLRVTVRDEVLFTNLHGEDIRLSACLWNGAATDAMYELVRIDALTHQKVRGGFYVPRSA